MLTAQEKQAWLAELRDPNNTKITRQYFGKKEGALGDIDYVLSQTCMCAVGCLVKASAKVSGANFFGADIINRIDNDEGTGEFKTGYWYDIIEMNDEKKLSFTEIADWVEKNVPTCN